MRPRLSTLRLSPAREHEIVDELSQHLEDRWRELVASGTSEDAAVGLALGEFRDGNLLAQYMAPLQQAQTPAPITPGATTGHVLRDVWLDLSLVPPCAPSQTMWSGTRDAGRVLWVLLGSISILHVKRMLVYRGMMLSGIGIAIGVAVAVGITRWMASLLFGVTPVDAATFAAAAGVLVMAALAASYVPARRAAFVDPVNTLSAQ